jgi:hypothetical protein
MAAGNIRACIKEEPSLNHSAADRAAAGRWIGGGAAEARTARQLRQARCLPGCLGGLYRVVQFVLGLMQELFGFGSMPSHIIVVRGACAIHLVDRLDHMFVDFVKVVPIPHGIGNGYSRCEGECRGYYERCFLHVYSGECT